MKIYFAGSIRGGRTDASLYAEIIDHLDHKGTVLTEHVGHKDLNLLEQGVGDEAIYRKDTSLLKECDLVIAECTCPSLGVGYELAFAERHGKPCHIFYDRTKVQLSAMLKGDPYFNIHPYENAEDIFPTLDIILEQI